MSQIINKLKIEGYILLLFWLSCCGYSTKSLLPSHFKNIYIEIFENRTIKIGLGEEMTREIIKQLTADGSLRVSGESKAQLKITGQISYFNKEPYVYSGNQTIDKYRISLRCNVQCIDLVKNEVYWEGEVSDWALIEQNQDESIGISEAMTKVAKETVRRILTNW